MKKKLMALAVVAAMLAIAVVGGTLAYFTDEDEKTNTFTTAKIDISLNEQQRGENGLEAFEDDKVMLPVVGYDEADGLDPSAAVAHQGVRLLRCRHDDIGIPQLSVVGVEVADAYAHLDPEMGEPVEIILLLGCECLEGHYVQYAFGFHQDLLQGGAVAYKRRNFGMDSSFTGIQRKRIRKICCKGIALEDEG